MITRCLQGNWAPFPSLAEGDTQWFALKPDSSHAARCCCGTRCPLFPCFLPESMWEREENLRLEGSQVPQLPAPSALHLLHVVRVLRLVEPALQQRFELAHVLEAELESFEAADGRLAEHLPCAGKAGRVLHTAQLPSPATPQDRAPPSFPCS